jgi:hypothetical protein
MNNKQAMFSVLAVVLATALFVSLIVDNADAQRRNRQSINQGDTQTQSSAAVTSGVNSGVTNSGSQAATATNTNNGGNDAGGSGGSGHHHG